MIIVLGESVTAVGLGLSDIEGSTTLIAVACFVLAAALWWDYFVFGYWSARRGLLGVSCALSPPVCSLCGG